MKTLYIKERINYDGSQLAPHWIYNGFSLLGDAIVAFGGEVRVSLDNMVDLTDVKNNDFIYSPLMLNFIVEHFSADLEKTVLRQRMLIVLIKEELEEIGINVIRSGDDLYINNRKLSVSIATSSLVSTLIHVGLNIETQGTPVPTVGLKELGITAVPEFAQRIMDRYIQELAEIDSARCKVRGVTSER